MHSKMLLLGLLLLGLTACAEPKVVSADPSERADQGNKPLGEKCEDAKQQLDKSVAAGQLSDLRELKRNIELYCLWRRN
jgi:hypothetical protein